MDIFPAPRRPPNSQAGVSLVEIVVTMFLFAITSVAVLPLMMGATQVSAANRDLVAVNSHANAQLSAIEAAFPSSAENSCAAVVAVAASGIVDPSGSGATATISFGNCPDSYPATVTVTVQGFRPNATKAAITLTSAILVVSP